PASALIDDVGDNAGPPSLDLDPKRFTLQLEGVVHPLLAGDWMALGQIAHGTRHGCFEPLECRGKIVAHGHVDVRGRNRWQRIDPGTGGAGSRRRKFLVAAPARHECQSKERPGRAWRDRGIAAAYAILAMHPIGV